MAHSQRRVWDVAVGIIMILTSLAFQVVISAFTALAVGFAIAEWQDWSFASCFWILFALQFVVFNIAAFYDFYRRRRINRVTVTGEAGIFHLVPRAIHRMRFGTEGVVQDAR